MLRSNRSIDVPRVSPLLAWLAAGAIVLAGCSGAASPTPAASAAASTAPSVAASAASPAASASASAACPIPPCDQPIVIGVSQALTGDKSDPGTAIEHGYQVWVKEINAAGGLLGRQVVLKEYDNQSLADTAVSQIERLVTVDKVDLLFGPFSSALTIPTSAIAEKYKYAFIEGAGGAPGVFQRQFHYTFFVQPATAEHQADPFVTYILSLPAAQRPKTAAYPQQDDPFVKATEDGAQATLEAAGIKTVYHAVYPPTQTDFASIAAAVKASGADIVLGGTIFGDAVAQVQAYASINYQPKAIYFTSGPSTTGPFEQALGSKVNGIFTGDGWIQSSKATGNAQFVADYHAMFPKEVDIPGEAAEGYSVGQVLLAAVTATQSLDNTKIADWLHANSVQTVQGPIGWDSIGRPNGSYLLEQYQSGKLYVVAPANDPNKGADPVYPKPNW
ncbi:MAG: amino acid ABC transporter substrate-binding protein [Candidatus Limnocylindrales bacterium]